MGSHIHCKIGNIKEIMQGRHVVSHCMAYRFVPFPVTLFDFEGHSPVA